MSPGEDELQQLVRTCSEVYNYRPVRLQSERLMGTNGEINYCASMKKHWYSIKRVREYGRTPEEAVAGLHSALNQK